MSLNRWEGIGNLGRDPELRYTQDGQAVANFSMATTERWTDKNTGEKQERTEWHNIVVWGKLAELVAEYLHKGRQVFVSGPLQTRKWQDRDGNDRYTTECKARDVVFLQRQESDRRRDEDHGDDEDAGDDEAPPPTDDDIPF